MPGIDDILGGNLMSEDNFNTAYNAIINKMPDGIYLFMASNYEIPAASLSQLEQNVEKLIRPLVRFRGPESKGHIVYVAKGNQNYLKLVHDSIKSEQTFKKLVEKKGTEIRDVALKPKTEKIGGKTVILAMKKLEQTKEFSVQTLNEKVSPAQFRQDVENYVSQVLHLQAGYFFAALYTGEKETISLPDAEKKALGEEKKFNSEGKKYHLFFRQFETPEQGLEIFEKIKIINDFFKLYGKIENGKPAYTTPAKMKQEVEEKKRKR